jgi:DNA invertase Pin-like site-specific DNA recombinase
MPSPTRPRNIVAQLQAKGVEFKAIEDPSIDITSRTGKLVMGILALIAEFENDIRRERQQPTRLPNLNARCTQR